MPNVFRPDLFPLDRELAALRRAGGQRVAAFPLEAIHALHLALLEQMGENAADALYRSGYEWALQEMIGVAQRLRHELGDSTDLTQMDACFVLNSWWAPFAEAGWGLSTFQTGALGRGVVLIDVQASAVAAALSGSDQPACHLYAGLFAGAVSWIERTERHAAEMQCAACGAARCTFIVGPGADVDAAETQRQSGTPTSEILRPFL